MPYVFDFDHSHRRPPMEMKDLLGGKGANLAEMTSVLHLPVPPGFTISTDACRAYMEGGWPEGLTGRAGPGPGPPGEGHGQGHRRPGRPPPGLGALGGQVLHARDDGHRPQPGPERPVGRGSGQADRRRAVRLRLLPPLRRHVRADRARHRRATNSSPSSTRPRSWPGPPRTPGCRPNCCATWSTPTSRSSSATPASPSPRIRRRSCGGPSRRSSAAGTAPGPSPTASVSASPHTLGTAVNVQAMVFGNRDDKSGTGVGFTRDPATGEQGSYGDFLVNAQGEDVVAGIRNTEPLSRSGHRLPQGPPASCSTSSTGSSTTTATCATPSSPSTRASSGCSRPGWASGPVGRRSRWRWT